MGLWISPVSTRIGVITFRSPTLSVLRILLIKPGVDVLLTPPVEPLQQSIGNVGTEQGKGQDADRESREPEKQSRHCELTIANHCSQFKLLGSRVSFGKTTHNVDFSCGICYKDSKDS